MEVDLFGVRVALEFQMIVAGVEIGFSIVSELCQVISLTLVRLKPHKTLIVPVVCTYACCAHGSHTTYRPPASEAPSRCTTDTFFLLAVLFALCGLVVSVRRRPKGVSIGVTWPR